MKIGMGAGAERATSPSGRHKVARRRTTVRHIRSSVLAALFLPIVAYLLVLFAYGLIDAAKGTGKGDSQAQGDETFVSPVPGVLLLLGLVATRGATAISIGGDPAVVWDDEASTDQACGAFHSPIQRRLVARRIAVSRVVGVRDCMLSFTLTVVGPATKPSKAPSADDSQRLVVDALSGLFDSIIASVRWLDGDEVLLV